VVLCGAVDSPYRRIRIHCLVLDGSRAGSNATEGMGGNYAQAYDRENGRSCFKVGTNVALSFTFVAQDVTSLHPSI